jgi:hypothetical protein
MEITETVRRSTWHQRSHGRRVLTDDLPYFSISESDGVAHRDALRRESLARLANSSI